MVVSCWSAKGGSGTTVVAVSLALVLAARGGSGVLLVDLAGDAPAVLGLADPGGPGLAAWAAAGAEVLHKKRNDQAVEMSNRQPPVPIKTTDSEGRYRMSNLPAGSYRISVYAPAYVIDGEKRHTLRGPTIAEEFQQIVEAYVERRYGRREAA